MSTIDRVDIELRKLIDGLPQGLEFIDQSNLSIARGLSKKALDSRPAFGSTQGLKKSIPSGESNLDLYFFYPQPRKEKLPCLIWLHGGGYLMGRANDTWFGPFFSESAGYVVVSVEYRLAPEFPFPATLNDVMAALDWTFKNAELLGIDENNIHIGGASAGAGLAAGAALYNRDHSHYDLKSQLLLYPMLDNLHDTVSGRVEDHPIWNRKTSLNAWDMYLAGNSDLDTSIYAAPSRAVDLSGLPKAVIHVGEVDLFLDENINYHHKLEASGVDSKLNVYEGMFHGGEVLGVNTVIGRGMLENYVKDLKALAK